MCFGLLVVHFEVPKNGRAKGFFGKSGDVLYFERLSELLGQKKCEIGVLGPNFSKCILK